MKWLKTFKFPWTSVATNATSNDVFSEIRHDYSRLIGSIFLALHLFVPVVDVMKYSLLDFSALRISALNPALVRSQPQFLFIER